MMSSRMDKVTSILYRRRRTRHTGALSEVSIVNALHAGKADRLLRIELVAILKHLAGAVDTSLPVTLGG